MKFSSKACLLSTHSWLDFSGQGKGSKSMFFSQNSRKNWNREVYLVAFCRWQHWLQRINIGAFYVKGQGHLKGKHIIWIKGIDIQTCKWCHLLNNPITDQEPAGPAVHMSQVAPTTCDLFLHQMTLTYNKKITSGNARKKTHAKIKKLKYELRWGKKKKKKNIWPWKIKGQGHHR